MLLLVAAILKAHQLVAAPSLSEGLLHARWFSLLIVLGELTFGICLLSGLLPKPTWFLTILSFSVFAVVSGYSYWISEESCGCLGSVVVPPLWIALFDIIIVGLLIIFRPVGLNFCRKEVYQELLESKKRIILVSFVWLLLMVPIVCWGALAIANDFVEHSANMVLREKTIDLGEVDIEEMSFEFVLVNKKSFGATMMGTRSSCACARVEQAHDVIPANGTLSVPVNVKNLLDKPNAFHHAVTFYFIEERPDTKHRRLKKLTGHVKGYFKKAKEVDTRILAPPPEHLRHY